MITIAFNEEENGQANEENQEDLEGINTASDKIVSDENKEKINDKKESAKESAKKILKSKKIRAFILSHLVPILIVIGIILLILIIIGLFSFFTTMPGMMLEKIKEFGRRVWGDFVGFFTGDDVTASVSEEDVLDLAQYIENMGYDIESCGFGKAEYEEKTEDNNNSTKQITSIGESPDEKEYLKAYIAANEATYVPSRYSLKGFLKSAGSELVAFVTSDPNELVGAKEVSTGMINILDATSVLPFNTSQDFVNIDRENEKMTVYTNAIYEPISGWIRRRLGSSDTGAWQWGSTFSYDMSSWTAKYGRPVELFLSVHLSTMMPDLAYRLARDAEFNTKVNIVLQDINVKYDASIKSIGGNTANITSDEIINAFLNYGLSGQKYEYEYTVEEPSSESTDNTENDTTNQVASNTTSETNTQTITGEVNFYNEIIQNAQTQDERNKIARAIIREFQNNFLAQEFGVNVYNAMVDDSGNNPIFNAMQKYNLITLFKRFIIDGNDKYIVYIKEGDEQVPGLDGITYDDLIELVDIVTQGIEDGIDGVKWPYIQSVTNHWYYKDIDFSTGVYRKASTAKKKIQYESADSENSSLSKHNIEVELDATLTADEGIVYQVCEPEAEGPNKHIKEIFADSYYKYDGTIETAKKIENAKLYDKYKNAGQTVTYNGNQYTIEEPTVEKQKVSFEENKSNALAAFSILENMHTEASDFVYRNLKDLVVNLKYFTKDELTSDLKNAMLWIIKTDNKNEEFEIGKDENEYGIVIKDVGGREVIAPENCKVSVDDEGVVTLKFTKMSDSTIELLKYIYEDDYKNINPDILVGLTMKIKGIKDVTTGKVKRGETIGTATGDLNVIMFDIDKSVIENIEEYMVQEHNNKYEEVMVNKKAYTAQGIDIGRIPENEHYTGSNSSGGTSGGPTSTGINPKTGFKKWTYSEAQYKIICAVVFAEAGNNPPEWKYVVTTMCNMADTKLSGVDDPLSECENHNHFSTYGPGWPYEKWLSLDTKYPNTYQALLQEVKNVIENGIRYHDFIQFRATQAGYSNRVQFTSGGNWYFDPIR